MSPSRTEVLSGFPFSDPASAMARNPQMETLAVGFAYSRFSRLFLLPWRCLYLFLWMKPQSHPPLPQGLYTVALRTAPSLSLRRADRLLDRGCPPSAWAVTGLLPLQGASVAFCLLKGICVPCPGGASDLAPQRCQVSGWRWARGCGRGRSSGNVRGPGGCCPWPLGRLRLAGREDHCEMEETPLPSCLGFS